MAHRLARVAELLVQAGRVVVRVGEVGRQAQAGVVAGERGRRVPVLSRSVIPKEKLLASGADLYIDSFAAMRMSGMGDAPTEEEFRAAGIKCGSRPGGHFVPDGLAGINYVSPGYAS